MEIFRNRLQRELLDLDGKVYAAYVKARQDGQTNPLIAFEDFLGFQIGCYQKEGGPEP